MCDRLKVDLGELNSTASTLRLLVQEFKSAAEFNNSADIGHPVVLGAVKEFIGNWSRHRERLVRSMDAVGAMAEESYQTYVKTEEDLASKASGGR